MPAQVTNILSTIVMASVVPLAVGQLARTIIQKASTPIMRQSPFFSFPADCPEECIIQNTVEADTQRVHARAQVHNRMVQRSAKYYENNGKTP